MASGTQDGPGGQDDPASAGSPARPPGNEGAPTGGPGDVVRLTVAPHEMAAEMICSLLRSEGIRCTHRISDMAISSGVTAVVGGAALPGEVLRGSGGPREVLVLREDLERAAEMIATDGSQSVDS